MKHGTVSNSEQQAIREVRSIVLSKSATLTLFVWFTLISLLITGYKHIYGSNHAYQLILVQKLNDPTLYPNDPFTDTVYHYASVFWYIVAWVSRFVDISVVLFALFLVSKLLFLLAGFRLACTFFPNSVSAPIVGVAVMAVPPRPVLGDVFVVDYTQQSSFAIAALLLALDSLLNKRWFLLAVWLGIAINMNLMYAIFGITYLFSSIIIYIRNYEKNIISKILAAFVGAVLIGVPGIYLATQAATYEAPDPVAVWQACELSFPFHFFPQTWGMRSQFFTLIVSLVALILACWFRKIYLININISENIILWSLVAFVWYLIGWLNPTMIHSLPLLHLHPVRATGIWLLLSILFIVTAGIFWIESKRVAWGTVPTLFVVLMIIFVVFAHAVRTKPFWFLVAATLCGSEIARQVLKRRGMHLIQNIGVVASVSILLTFISTSGVVNSLERVSQTGNWMGIGSQPAYQIAKWARENTDREVVFLIPIQGGYGWQAFRYLSQRNVFTHLKDGTAWTYAPWFADDWLERLRALGFHEVIGLDDKSFRIGSWIHIWTPDGKHFAHVYDKVDDSRVEKLRKQYRIDYWITRATVPTRFPKVYEYEGWQVLKVSDPFRATR